MECWNAKWNVPLKFTKPRKKNYILNIQIGNVSKMLYLHQLETIGMVA